MRFMGHCQVDLTHIMGITKEEQEKGAYSNCYENSKEEESTSS